MDLETVRKCIQLAERLCPRGTKGQQEELAAQLLMFDEKQRESLVQGWKEIIMEEVPVKKAHS